MSYQHLWQPKVPKKKHPMLNCHLTSVNLVPFNSNLSKCKLLHFRCFNFLVNLPNWIPPTRSPVTGWYRRFTAPLRALDDGFRVRQHLVLRRVLGHPSFLPVGFPWEAFSSFFHGFFHGFKRFLKVPHGKKETRPFCSRFKACFWGDGNRKQN